MRQLDEKARQGAADQAAQDRNAEAVTEIRSAFSRNRKDGMRDAGTQIPSRVNRESGGASQTRADGPNGGANQKRNQSRSGIGLDDGRDNQHQQKGANDLADQIRHGVPNG